MQDIRNAVSEKFVQLQADAFAFLPRDLDLIVLEIAFDETEEPITLGQVRSETVHVMTLHGRIFYRAGMEHNKIELVMPPAVLESTSANNLKAALLRRLPWSLAQHQVSLQTVRLACQFGQRCRMSTVGTASQ